MLSTRHLAASARCLSDTRCCLRVTLQHPARCLSDTRCCLRVTLQRLLAVCLTRGAVYASPCSVPLAVCLTRGAVYASPLQRPARCLSDTWCCLRVTATLPAISRFPSLPGPHGCSMHLRPYIGVQLIYSVVSVSTTQQSASVVHTHASTLADSVPTTEQRAERPAPHGRLWRAIWLHTAVRSRQHQPLFMHLLPSVTACLSSAARTPFLFCK